MNTAYRILLAASLATISFVSPAGGTGSGTEGKNVHQVIPTTAEEVVREVVERNRGTKALESQAAAAAEVPSQAGSLPDPFFMVGLSNLPLSTDSTPLTGIQFELRQTFPWPGKLALREQAAGHNARLRQHLVTERRNLLRAHAWSLLWELAFLREHRRLAGEMAATLNQFVAVAESSYVAGSGRQQDLIKPQVERYRIDDLVESIDRQAATLRARLNALRHRPAQAPIDPPNIPEYNNKVRGQPQGMRGQAPDKGPDTRLFSSDKLLEFAKEHNPLFRAARQRVEAARSMLALAGKDYFPDISVGLQYRLRWVETMDAVAGADFVGLTLGVNLPVWFASKQRPAEAQREAELAAALAEEQRLGDDIAAGLEAVVQALERDTTQAGIYQEQIIPETRQALESSLADYRAGRLEFISVLDNLLKLFSARVELVRRTTRIQASGAELEHLLGGRPSWLERFFSPALPNKEHDHDH